MATATSFSARLLRWFKRRRRDLPWRRDRTAYRILVSEVMLQQTTVTAALPYFERFTTVLPNFEALAEAEEDAVLALWSGLGYYRRARNLRLTAQAVMERHGGDFPRTLEEALALPGVGPYTAGAVLGLAHGIPAPAVDGNVARALSRWLGRPLLLARQRDRKELEAAASRLQPPRDPGTFNEALIELGATVCKPRSPDCASCPVAADCRALGEDLIAELPPPKPRPAMRDVDAVAAFALRRGRVLLQRRSESEAVLPGMWELPGGFTESTEPVGWLEESVLPALGGGRVGERLLTWKHVITNRRITVHVHAVELDRRLRSGKSLRWTTPEEAGSLPLTGTTARLLSQLVPD